MKGAVIMKKILIVLSLIVALVSLSAPVFAAYSTGNLTFGTQTILSIATSKNVQIEITFSGTSNPVLNYVISTYHQTGTRTFGSSNADAKLYFYEATGQAQPTVPTTSGTAPTWTGWSAL
jgi:hypothetical protein